MNYQELINYRLKDEKACIFIISVMLISIFIGLLIIGKLSITSVMVLLIVFIIFVGQYIYRKSKFNKLYEKLTKAKKQSLDEDLKNTLFFSGRDYVLSSKYIISFVNPKIISYSSILIIDKASELDPKGGKHSCMCDMVYVFTKDLKFKFIIKEYKAIPAKEAYYNLLYSYIKAQNPNVLEGYTKENRKKIEEKYKIKI